MKRVLITGASGFVGGHLTDYLKETHPDWQLYFKNTNQSNELSNLPQMDYIINLASTSSVEHSVAAPTKLIKNNVNLMLEMLEFARENKPTVFLHLSTVEVYNVTNPYAASKAAQEEIANAYWKTYGVPVLIARSSNIIGPRQSNDKFVPKIVEQIKADQKIKIYTSDGVVGSRVYNTVYNVCSALNYMLAIYPKLQDYNKDFPVHFDIGGGQRLTNLDMALGVAQRLGKELDYELFEPTTSRPTYPQSLNATGHNLEEYGWRPLQTLEEGLAWIK